jgi:hypothetical protein
VKRVTPGCETPPQRLPDCLRDGIIGVLDIRLHCLILHVEWAGTEPGFLNMLRRFSARAQG